MADIMGRGTVFGRHIEEQRTTIVGYSHAPGAKWCMVYQTRDAPSFTEHEIDPWNDAWNDAWSREGLQATIPHHAQVIAAEQVRLNSRQCTATA